MNFLAARSAPAFAVSTKLLAPKDCQVHHEEIENILFSKESCLKPLAIPLRGMLPVRHEGIENILFSKEVITGYITSETKSLS